MSETLDQFMAREETKEEIIKRVIADDIRTMKMPMVSINEMIAEQIEKLMKVRDE